MHLKKYQFSVTIKDFQCENRILYKIAMHEKIFIIAFSLTNFVKWNHLRSIMPDHESIFNVFKTTYFKLLIQYFNTLCVNTTALILVLNERF